MLNQLGRCMDAIRTPAQSDPYTTSSWEIVGAMRSTSSNVYDP